MENLKNDNKMGDSFKSLVDMAIGLLTTSISIEQIIEETTPIIKYIGLVAGTTYTIVALFQKMRKKKE